MNWDAIGTIAELLGTVAIVVTLIYLIKQIRQSTDTAQGTTFHSITRARNEYNLALASDPDLVDLLLRGNTDYRSLDRKDRFRYTVLIRGIFDMIQDNWIQYKKGLIPPEIWRQNEAGILDILATPGGKLYFKRERHRFASDLLPEIEKILAAANQEDD